MPRYAWLLYLGAVTAYLGLVVAMFAYGIVSHPVPWHIEWLVGLQLLAVIIMIVYLWCRMLREV